MTATFEVIRNQRFEIGRTINLARCDCVECDFLHCPKNNYALKFKKKIRSVDEFWTEHVEEMLKSSVYSKALKPVEIRMTFSMLIELMDNCISFPDGTYWSAGDFTTAKEFPDEFLYENIEIHKISRSGCDIKLGEVRMSDGEITDIDLNLRQRKLAEKISAAFMQLRKLATEEYEKRDTSCVGWMDRSGRLYKCRFGQHSKLAEVLGANEWLLENRGWVKIFYDLEKDCGYYCNWRESPEQINSLIELGYMNNE